MSQPDPVGSLLAFLQASPTPWHAVDDVARLLDHHGFDPIDLGAEPKPMMPGTRGYVRQGGAIVAFQTGMEPVAETGYRVVSAHTDSPNLRVKPQAVVKGHGYLRLAVEVYGGAILATWTDRDLGLAGRVFVRDGDGARSVLVNVRRPIARIPNVAIHLNRQVNEDGLKLNAQTHLPAVFALEGSAADPLRDLLAAEAGVPADQILTWDLALYDLTAPTRGGLNDEFVFSGRLDNLASSHAAIHGLLGALDSGFDGRPCAPTAVVALHDHEEVGSSSTSGAGGRLVETVLHYISNWSDPKAEGGLDRALANSWHLSVDMAHAIHPAYVDRHEPGHHPALNQGVVIKQNAQQRYATDAETAARVARLCEQSAIPYQWYVHRTDLPCGSTVGPIVASRLGVRTVDVGNPMLSMHSAREMSGALDHPHMISLVEKFLRA